MDFENKTALITGAASGMGYLTGKCFVREGGNAVLTDINPETLEKAVSSLNEIRSGSAVGVVCDVRDYAQVCNARDCAVEAFGSIDLLVTMAGGAETRIKNAHGEFPDIPIDVYDWGLDVNLKGQFYFDHAVAKQMREQKSGVIINIGSITGEEGSPDAVAYSASKSAAMNGLVKSVAQFGMPHGIRCCCVAPGPVLTRPGMANMKTLMGRAAQPQEIVDLILYLASDKGAFITGTTFLIDGGRNIMFNKL
ncbi:MAG TPA: SDR family oxidoreductase [Candidatus Eisenbergiella merdipullorum]|uniref:SDR family oxidoreductase n=1 Tax=Candidatus Eisenbergiella merdipullorum TaxID=2838553 RepID=A0A9D2I6K3_9FIRM|nr:SDR family oxidoreductase [Candidatus Eisenbergiella merdipullorum]